MNDHLRAAWAAAAAPQSGARFRHVFLPADSDEAYRALVHLSSHTANRHTAVASEYDHARLHDLVNDEGFSHHPVHGTPGGTGFMASYDAPEGSGEAQVHHISDLTPDHIAAHRDAIGHHLAKPNSYQGGWHDTTDGKVYLDASRHFGPHEEGACREHCADQKQKAYFKLDDFSEKYMDPRHDPLAMKDEGEWRKRYSNVGTAPHPRYHEYGDRYPASDDQKKFWGDKGQHLAGKGVMAGRPVGPWRSDRYVEEQLHGGRNVRTNS